VTVRIVTDSASDLPKKWRRHWTSSVVPLHVRFGADELVDRHQLSVAEFWARCAASADLPETAAPSPVPSIRFRRPAGRRADGVVCVTLSAKLSATNEAASQRPGRWTTLRR